MGACKYKYLNGYKTEHGAKQLKILAGINEYGVVYTLQTPEGMQTSTQNKGRVIFGISGSKKKQETDH